MHKIVLSNNFRHLKLAIRFSPRLLHHRSREQELFCTKPSICSVNGTKNSVWICLRFESSGTYHTRVLDRLDWWSVHTHGQTVSWVIVHTYWFEKFQRKYEVIAGKIQSSVVIQQEVSSFSHTHNFVEYPSRKNQLWKSDEHLFFIGGSR